MVAVRFAEYAHSQPVMLWPDDEKSVEDPLESEPECGSSVQVVSVQSLPSSDWQF